ncbi:hypothetical protein BDP27DRAFT_1427515 [Rhodocollybia butyracea]|uniref:Uncharacterized protein n=1 Tax=Rhodocollybia butyracea TaxID=206335 RepID=A0A9P5PGM0_9AGAR|nr:hypothetical protein BDP27DRAFT_1374406 [Rhodocollybia butyracea]KAF9062827.1 hypothetical protein BDP27DRAFT_1427515 [Rhodocollybia butyracea]
MRGPKRTAKARPESVPEVDVANQYLANLEDTNDTNAETLEAQNRRLREVNSGLVRLLQQTIAMNDEKEEREVRHKETNGHLMNQLESQLAATRSLNSEVRRLEALSEQLAEENWALIQLLEDRRRR